MIKSKYPLSLFIFRRDLRLEDNKGLIEALNSSSLVLPCFIIDPSQAKPHPYRSEFALRFLGESLEDLQKQLDARGARLYVFEGKAEAVIERVIKCLKVQAVFVNRDYTPFSVSRDLGIKKTCENRGVEFHSCSDLLLHEPEEIYKNEGGPYTVFTPFYRKSQTLKVKDVQGLNGNHFYKQELSELSATDLSVFLNSKNPTSPIKGGRNKALEILGKIKEFKDYDQKRDIPSLDATSHLSAHHKFGTVSMREVYHLASKTLGKDHTFVKELFWRDFFTHIAYHFPHVFGQSFYEQYEQLSWVKNRDHFERWSKGMTGFPIVDAGMRQLNTTGFMHNRVRMITASFLVKDLHIDWREGEKYFATKLVDYDPAVNNGNWQWAASTGCDHQPYFRIFNPWLQQEKFDPECFYIKQWIPSLRDVDAKQIHCWYETKGYHKDYPSSMLDHRIESEKAKAMFVSIKS